MRFIVLFGLCLPLAVATIVEAGRGNPVAIGILLPIGAAVGLVVTSALLSAPMPPPRADPAKIARLERELDIADALDGPASTPEQRANDLADAAKVPDRLRPDFIESFMQAHERARDSEAATAPMAKPPAERNVEDCPRPEGCVIAHPCRKCGADCGQACVGDPYAEHTAEAQRIVTFHGAPTFGHKIEGP